MRTLDPTMAADLFVFSEVTACGSFTGAAERMRVTQGAVSQRIARLEKRLGEPLFFPGFEGARAYFHGGVAGRSSQARHGPDC